MGLQLFEPGRHLRQAHHTFSIIIMIISRGISMSVGCFISKDRWILDQISNLNEEILIMIISLVYSLYSLNQIFSLNEHNESTHQSSDIR